MNSWRQYDFWRKDNQVINSGLYVLRREVEGKMKNKDFDSCSKWRIIILSTWECWRSTYLNTVEEQNSSGGEVEDGTSGEKKQSNFKLQRRLYSFLICQYKKLWSDLMTWEKKTLPQLKTAKRLPTSTNTHSAFRCERGEVMAEIA